MEFRHELVFPNEDIPCRLFLFEGMNGNYRVTKHWHRCVELFAVLEGNIDFYINNRHYPVMGQNLLLVNSNEIHSIEAPEANRVIVLQIPFHFLEAYCEEGYIRFNPKSAKEDTELFITVVNAFQEYEEKACGYGLAVQSSMFRLLHCLLTRHRVTETEEEWLRSSRHINKLSYVTDFISANYFQDLSLNGIADKFGFSPTYLSKMFQKYAGVNYKAYVQNVRVENGYKELVNTEHAIGDIAYNNGFANIKSFSKMFLRRYGLLPSDYRRMFRQREEVNEMEGQEMKSVTVLRVTDDKFNPYGRIIRGYHYGELLLSMEKIPLTEGVVYEPSVKTLERLPIKEELEQSFFGGMPIQIGYCNGHNSLLNAVEYHRCSELNLAATDLILLLGRIQDIKNDFTYDTSLIEAFYVPEGTCVELYGTTLHYAPCGIEGNGFRCAVILPEGTNSSLHNTAGHLSENRLLFARNKWLIGHEESGLGDEGGFIGLKGDNISIK